MKSSNHLFRFSTISNTAFSIMAALMFSLSAPTAFADMHEHGQDKGDNVEKTFPAKDHDGARKTDKLDRSPVTSKSGQHQKSGGRHKNTDSSTIGKGTGNPETTTSGSGTGYSGAGD